MRNTFAVALLLLLCGLCFGQTSYKGLTPGKSTKAQVQRVLGLPVTKVNETLFEYRPQPLTSKIYVQYAEDSVVEKIEVRCRLPNSSCDDLTKSLNLHLPQEPSSGKADEQKWKFLYGSPLFIVTSGDMADATGDSLVPSRLAFYSRELYEAEFVRVAEANEAAIARADEPCGRSGNGGALYHHAPGGARLQTSEFRGCVSVQGADGSQAAPNPVAIIDVYRTDLRSHFETKTDKRGTFVFAGLPMSGTFLIVVSGPGLKWTWTKFLSGTHSRGQHTEQCNQSSRSTSARGEPDTERIRGAAGYCQSLCAVPRSVSGCRAHRSSPAQTNPAFGSTPPVQFA